MPYINSKVNLLFALTQLSSLEKTGIYCIENENITSFDKNKDGNPIYRNAELRRKIIEGTKKQDEPYIWTDGFDVFFSGIASAEAVYLIGPLSLTQFDRVTRHKFYRHYGIEENLEKNLRQFTVTEIFQLIKLLASLLKGTEYDDRVLVDANGLLSVTQKEENDEKIRFNILSDQEDFYRHSYQEEVQLLKMVEEGNVKEALRFSKEMDQKIGKLGRNELAHWQNMLIVNVTLCARAAIRGGIKPYIAYQISGFYINKGSECTNVTQVIGYRNHAIEELTNLVYEFRAKKHTSSFTEQCKDYILKNYRKKIYLDEIAEMLGISTSYLSRLFKKETGSCIQDYINQVRVERAANLLVFTDEALPMIAEYVNFPSQSYLGKMFKKYKAMTPRQYREKYKPMELWGQEDAKSIKI